jgi:hypothetical protein
MNRNRLLAIGLTFLIVAFIFIQPAYVGPGSKIAKTILSSFWGSLFFIGLVITCLPLSVYQYVCGKLEEQRLIKNSR